MIKELATAALISAVLSSAATWRVTSWYNDSNKLKAVEQTKEDAQERREVADTAATKHEGDKVKIETKFVTITEKVENVVEKIVYRDRVCFDDDGVRVLNEAVRAADHPSQPQDPVR